MQIVPALAEQHKAWKAARERMERAAFRPTNLAKETTPPPIQIEKKRVIVEIDNTRKKLRIRCSRRSVGRRFIFCDEYCYNPLSPIRYHTPSPFSADEIVARIAAKHKLTKADIFGQSRIIPITEARHEAMVEVAKAFPRWSYPRLGRFFNRDHTTVMHAVKKHGVIRYPTIPR